jgi:CspA family cold shock protein
LGLLWIRDSGDIFVHFSAIVTKGFRTLKEAEEVEYELDEHQRVHARRML